MKFDLIFFLQTSLRREDPIGSATRSQTAGCHLASDEQCRIEEDDKPAIGITDDDVWVVPYDDSNMNQQQLKTQFQDTKL